MEASGLKGWTHFAALPKNPGTDADRYEAGANCGRCVKVKCSCHQELFPGACAAGEEVILPSDHNVQLELEPQAEIKDQRSEINDNFFTSNHVLANSGKRKKNWKQEAISLL